MFGSWFSRRSVALVCLGGLVVLASGCGNREKSVPELIKLLKSPEPKVRQQAAEDLRLMHEKGYPAIPALMENFEDEDDGAWRFAVDAVAFLGEPSANHLIEAAKSENARRRAGGVRGIGLLRADIKIAHDKEMVPLLVKGLKDEHVEVRRWSAFALGLYGPMGEGATTIPAQIEALEREQDTHVLCYLLEAIGGHGEGARAAVPVVVKLYKESKDQFVRGAAGIAISHFKANGLYQPAEGELPANDEPRPPARRPEPPAGRP